MALTKVIGSGVGDLSTFTIDGSANDLMTFRTTGDSASQVLGLQFQNNSEAVTAQIFGTGDNSSSGVFRIKGIGSIELHGGDVAVSGDATNMLKIDANGHVTMPNQTAFGAIGSSAPTMPINTTYVLPLDTERFDQNGDYNTSNYTFTAPVTGRYQLNGSIYLYNYLDTSAGYIIFTLRTSNDEYQYPVQASMFGSDIGSFGMNISHLVDMDASDTAVIDIFQQAGAAQTSISGGHSHFTGFLVA